MARDLAERVYRLQKALWAGIVSITDAQLWLWEARNLIGDLCTA